VTVTDILNAERFAEIVGPQARAFKAAQVTPAIKTAIDEAEPLAGVRAAALTTLPDWFADPVARIALFVLSQTAEGWDRDQLDAAEKQYRRAVRVLEGKRGTVNPNGSPIGTGSAASGSGIGTIDNLPTW
jgi:hypothetical protein